MCVTNNFGSTGSNVFTMVLYGNIAVNINTNFFNAVNPIVSSVTPTFGPIAGGTKLTVRGTGLRAGNHENTRVSLDVIGESSYTCNIL